MVKKSRNLLAVLTAFLLVLGLASSAFAHAIDYTAYDIQPQLNFDGKSGNFRLMEPVPAGSIFSFRLTLELIESAGGGTTTLPATVTFGVKNSVPHDLLVGFGASTDVAALPKTIDHTFAKVNNQIASLQTAVTVQAPVSPGSYFFKIQALSGYKGKGLEPGEGIVIHFKVAEQVAVPVDTILTVDLESPSTFYRFPEINVIATLKEKVSGAPVPGQVIDFFLEGAQVNQTVVATDVNGQAKFTYKNNVPDANGLPVGDYAITAKFQGTGNFLSSSGGATQCVTYRWLGFLPPILVQDPNNLGLGIGLFQGKVIPVKARIADFSYQPVDNAELKIYFAKTESADIALALAIQPTIAEDGNLMRYVSDGDFYMLNWNISALQNGSYNIRVGADEGSCAIGHWVPVRIGKASK